MKIVKTTIANIKFQHIDKKTQENWALFDWAEVTCTIWYGTSWSKLEININYNALGMQKVL